VCAAGRPRRVRTVGQDPRAVPPMAAERHLAADPRPAPGLAGAKGAITWDLSVDSTVCRAHQHAAGARKQGGLQKEPPAASSPSPVITGWEGHAAGSPPSSTRQLSRSEAHVDRGDGRTARGLAAVRTRTGEGPCAPHRAGPAPRPSRSGACGQGVVSRRNRAYLCRRGIRCTIPDDAGQIRNRKRLGSRGGRPPEFRRRGPRDSAYRRVQH
jgi:hypothetical protein